MRKLLVVNVIAFAIVGLLITGYASASGEGGNEFNVDTVFSNSKLVPNNMFTAKMTAGNLSSTPYEGTKDVLLIVGLYNSNNTMLNVSYISKGIPYGYSETLSAGFKLPSDVTGCKVRAFMWDGTDLRDSMMTPISNVSSLPHDFSEPLPIPTPQSPAVQIFGGTEDLYWVDEEGRVRFEGDYTFDKECIPPQGLTGVKTLAAGKTHVLALKEDGSVIAWGNNDNGETAVPAELKNVKALAAGDFHSVALKEDGNVIAWGDDTYGQCDVPAGLPKIKAVAAGALYTVALGEDKKVYVWGKIKEVPSGLKDVTSVSAGREHILALKEDGTVTAWGDNFYGQINVPVGLTNVKAVAAGYEHSSVLKEDGTVVTWGLRMDQAALPEGDKGYINNNIKSIVAGGRYTAILTEDGWVIAWGYNDHVSWGVLNQNFVEF